MLEATQLTSNQTFQIPEIDISDKNPVTAAYRMIEFINYAKTVVNELGDSKFMDSFNSDMPTLACIQNVGVKGLLLNIQQLADYLRNAVIDLARANTYSMNYELSEVRLSS